MDIPIRMDPMSKLTLAEAVALVPVGRSKLYQGAAEGVISTDTYPRQDTPKENEYRHKQTQRTDPLP